MMKRYMYAVSFTALVLCVALLGSCRKEQIASHDPSKGRGIHFSTHVGGVSKGVSRDRFVAGDAFEVVGYSADAPFKDGTTGAISMPTTARLIFDQNDQYFPYKRALVRAKGAGDDLAWSYLPMVFWPSEGSVSFAAFSPTASKENKITANAATVAAVPSLSFEVFGGTKVYDKASLEAARLENVHQVDLLHSMNLDIAAEPAGGVELDFRHALTKVRFSVKGAQDEGILRIISVTLTGVINKGTMELIYNNTDAAKIDYLGGWRALPADTLGFPVVLNSVNAAAVGAGKVVSVVDDHEALLMIPQQLTQVKAHVVYAHSLDGGLTWQEYVSGDGATELSLATSGVPCWKPNMSINYIMDINPGLPVLFTAELRSWEYTQDQYVPKFEVPGDTSVVTSIALEVGDVVTTDPVVNWITIEQMAARSRAAAGATPLDQPYTVGAAQAYRFAVTGNYDTENKREAKIVITRGSGESMRTILLDVLQNPWVNYIEINKIRWTKGNLVANGAGGCKVGAPSSYGLYFHFGSLVGWAGGATGDGVGMGEPALAVQVKPVGYTGSTSWPAGYYTGGMVGTGYGLPTTDAPTTGVGDPCRYYLGDGWHTPSFNEFSALVSNAANQGPWVTTPYLGRWLGPTPGTVTSSIFFSAPGVRNDVTGSLSSSSSAGNYWNSSIYAAGSGYDLAFSKNGLGQQFDNLRFGFPVRCVQDIRKMAGYITVADDGTGLPAGMMCVGMFGGHNGTTYTKALYIDKRGTATSGVNEGTVDDGRKTYDYLNVTTGAANSYNGLANTNALPNSAAASYCRGKGMYLPALYQLKDGVYKAQGDGHLTASYTFVGFVGYLCSTEANSFSMFTVDVNPEGQHYTNNKSQLYYVRCAMEF